MTKALPLVTRSTPAASADLAGLSLSALLVKTNNAATLERVRTFLSTSVPSVVPPGGGSSLSAWQMGSLEAQTFGEVATIRNNDVTNIERVVLAALVLTLIVAGCSLAVTVGGSLVERRRQFTLLRVSGTSSGALRKVVLLESVLPLATAALVAAGAALGVAIPTVKAVLPQVAGAVVPGPVYYGALGAGLAGCLLVVCATLPLLSRITQPENARFE